MYYLFIQMTHRKMLCVNENIEDKPEFCTLTSSDFHLNSEVVFFFKFIQLYIKTTKSLEGTKKWNKTLEKKGYKKPQDKYNDKNEMRLHESTIMEHTLPPLDPECTFKPTQIDRRYAVYTHPGTYGLCPDGKEGWSCCLQYEKNSRGCIKKIIDPDAMNFASF